ncbi:MAG: phage tail protein [Saprospiraceae bacterium]|nr:phage tail protein [Saprospiraceae bacterium]
MMEPFLGQIQLFGFSFAPSGWALCNGQLLAISQNQALFSLLGTIYGGDGRTTFALPDLRGRTPLGFGQGAGLSNIIIGSRSGSETKTLTIANLPQHSHALTFGASTATGEENSPANNVIAMHGAAFNEDASAGASLKNASATSNVGSSQSFNLRDPYLALNYSIAVFGIFPSRS